MAKYPGYKVSYCLSLEVRMCCADPLAWSPKLYVTGHSLGGSIAALGQSSSLPKVLSISMLNFSFHSCSRVLRPWMGPSCLHFW